MSTDKTLADVQPGGKARLGDGLPEAVAQALATVNEAANDARHAGNYKVANALVTARITLSKQLLALSAQPSPGGQGEAREQFETWATSRGWPIQQWEGGLQRYCSYDTERMWEAFQAALAARQPVEFERAIPTRRRESAVELLLQLGFVWNNQRWEDRRQPVGEPVTDAGRSAAYDAIDRFLRNNMDDEAYAAYVEHLEALWAAVPAQAVDLGEMPDGWRLSKKATCYQLSHGNEIIGNLVGPDAEENAAIIARVLDSQAVGK
ncbi:hypothetical protein ACS0OT_07145 [Stenotrophomonas maltophilia group sp. RY12688]|uniref:hypothetical protein n=1 Tax=Stenotrophomonas maltophilia group sp. RY12688 TaxID=3454438 RepID=UPI003F9C0AF8